MAACFFVAYVRSNVHIGELVVSPVLDPAIAGDRGIFGAALR